MRILRGAVQYFDSNPAVFVENQGQWADPSVRYAYTSSAASIAFRVDGVQFNLSKAAGAGSGSASSPADSGIAPEAVESTTFSMQFVGANAATPVGEQKSGGVYNYYVGDQSTWRSNVAGYQTISYDYLYDGVTLKTFSQHGGMKYEFHVAAGTDYQQIQIHYDGIQGLQLGEDGSLHVQTALGEVIDDAPYIYQVVDGRQVSVAGRFQLLGAESYGFMVTGSYDSGRELIIDPSLAWATYLGGVSADHGYGIAVDTAGNALVTGETNSSNFTGINDTNRASTDAYVVKISTAGHAGVGDFPGWEHN